MIRELFDETMAVVQAEEGKRDTRFRNWVKKVTKVDSSKTNGYAFEGKWINEGTVDVTGPIVLLVKTTRGSRKYQTATYNVIVMNAAGELRLTDIRTTDKKRGWALRIRDAVAALLTEIHQQPKPEPPPKTRAPLILPSDSAKPKVTVILSAAGVADLEKLRLRLPALTDAEIVAASLTLNEMHTRSAQ